MKKTLFLATILSAVLSSAAFATTITVAGQEYDAAILTEEAAAAPESNYFLFASDQTVQNNTHNTWVMDLDNTKTIISAPATAEGATYNGNTIFFDTGGNGAFTVNANIIAGGFSGNALRFWGGASVTLNGTLTALTPLTIWNQNATHNINGAINADGVTVNITGGGTTVLGGGGTIGTLNKTDGNGNITMSAGTYNVTNLTLGSGRTITNSGATLNVTGNVSVAANMREIAPRAAADGNGFSRGNNVATIVSGSGATDFADSVTWTINGTVDSGATYNNGVVTGSEQDSGHYYVYQGGESFHIADAAGATQMTVNAPGQTVDLGSGSLRYSNLTINGGTVKSTQASSSGFVTGAVVVNGGATLVLAGSNDALGYKNGGDYTDSISLNGSSPAAAAVLDASTGGNHSVTMSTNLTLGNFAKVISSTGNNSFNTFGGSITVTGNNNEIATGLVIRDDVNFTVNNGASVTLSGNISGYSTSNNTLKKLGAGVLTVTGDITEGTGRLFNSAGTTIVKSASITGGTSNDGFIFENVTFSEDAHTLNGKVKLQGTTTLKGALTNNAALTIAGTVNVDSTTTIVNITKPETGTNGFASGQYLVYSGNEATLSGDVAWKLFNSADGVTYNYNAETQQGTLSTADNTTKLYYIQSATGWNTEGAEGAKGIVIDTNDTTNKVALGNGTYGVDTLTINSGLVETTHSGAGGFVYNGNLVMNGGTLLVAGQHDVFGYNANAATKSITMQNATIKLNQTTANTVTMKTDITMKGDATISSDTGKSFNSFGTTITATGTNNVIDTGITLRKHLTIDVQGADDTLVINKGLHYSTDSVDSGLTVTKKGEGTLTINGGLENYGTIQSQGGTLTIAGNINGRTEQTNLTLKNVTLNNNGTQNISGTVVLDSVTLKNRVDVTGSLTLQNTVTDGHTNQFSFVVGSSSGNGTLTFAAGNYDLRNHSTGIAVYTGSTMTVQNGATVSTKGICYSFNSPENNGAVTVDAGGTLNITGGSANGTYVGSLLANGVVSVAENLHSQTTLKVGEGGSYTQTAGTATVESFMDLAANGAVEIGNGNIVVNATSGDHGVWFKSGAHIDLTGTGTLSVLADNLVVAAHGSGTSTIKSLGGTAQIGNSTNFNSAVGFENTAVTVKGDTLHNYTISGGSVTIGTDETAVTTNIKSALSATTDMVVTAGSTAVINDAAVSVKSLDAAEASVVLGNSLDIAASTATVQSLTLNDGSAITVDNHDGTLTVTSSMSVSGHADVNADLVVSSGATLHFDGSITMGCAVEFGSNVTITLSDAIAARVNAGEIVTLIDGIDADSDITSLQGLSLYTGTAETGLVFLTEANLVLRDNGYALVTPEPATATLSLLALAALAARRKRH